jgi:hypothetical protein
MPEELTQKEKDAIVNEAITAITQICTIHQISINSLPRPLVNLLIDVFQAGASIAINLIRNQENKLDK